MREIRVKRRDCTGRSILEFGFKALDQLLDPDDPSPLPFRELTELAEETLAAYVNEYPLKRPMRITISIPQGSLTTELLVRLPETVHRHFAYRTNDLDHEKRLSLREGKISLLLAAINAIVAIIFVIVFAPFLEATIFLLLGGLVTILNWVTIWDTYEYFVYDWRQLVRKQRIYTKLCGMDVSILGGDLQEQIRSGSKP